MRGAALLSALVMLSTNASAIEPQHVWKYPCDVFFAGGCTRMPSDAELTYTVPADFGLYKLSNRAGPVLTMYTGTSPSRKSGTPALLLAGSGVVLEAYATKDADSLRLDIFVERREAGAVTTHIIGDLGPSNKEAFAQFVAGIRPCASSKSGAIACPQREDWGIRLAEYMKAASP